MTDTDESTRRIHCNSGRIGFLNTSNAWGAYCVNNGDWVTDFVGYAGNSFRAPVFYDVNDTTYYLDPNSSISLLIAGSVGINNTSPINTNWGDASNTKQLSIDASGAAVINLLGSGPRKYSMGVSSSTFYMCYDNTAGRHNLTVDANGSATFAVDVRSPIYYDSNNTAYYVDPASTSVLNALTVGNINGRSSAQLFYYQGFTLDANTMDSNASGFTYAVNAPYSGPIARLSEVGYSLQFNAAYSGGTGIAFRTRNGDTGSFNPWRVILNDANYTAYSPSLTGSGASGTWGISISGNAATATTATSATSATTATTATNLANNQSNWTTAGGSTNVVGMLSWRNYGNGHVIFDASAGLSPSGGSVNNTNSTSAWTATYPTLMGWNGSQTYGVRVDSARLADTAGSLTSMNISQFTNNSGYITSSGSISGSSGSVTHNSGRTDATAYPVVWASGSPSPMYSCNAVTITSSTGTLTATSLTETSSKRYKENIIDLHNSLEKVLAMRGVAYNRKGSSETEIGLIAEEVVEVVPEIINFTEDGEPDSVSYGRVTALLIESIKEQQKQIERQQKQIDDLIKLLNNK
jgi:hypothetical protein